jgi:ElaB/YqjD/DUF883 family membrane-anchored ribosome-binding protein
MDAIISESMGGFTRKMPERGAFRPVLSQQESWEDDMADAPTTAADRTVIDVSQEYECRYWSERFGVRTDELKHAVEAVGPMVADVARYFGIATDPSQEGVLEKAQRAARDVKVLAEAKARDVQHLAERTTDDVMKFIAARPVASILIGTAVGYVLGWFAAGAAHRTLVRRRNAARVRRVPTEHERLLRVSEWPRRYQRAR